MKYFELTCTAYLKNDIPFKESFEILSKYISYSMAQVEDLKRLHVKKGFKHYCFGGLLPIERAKVYTKGKTYHFIIRSLDETFIDRLSTAMRQNIDNPQLLIVETHKKMIKQFFVSEIYTVTPVIVSIQNGKFWTKEDDLMLLHRQLQDNLEKKYQDFYGEPIKGTQNFIQLFELKNNRLQTIQTSKIDKETGKVTTFRFFGNKFRIVPNEDEVSQKLAFMALACGLGEKNSFGGGVCLGKGMRV